MRKIWKFEANKPKNLRIEKRKLLLYKNQICHQTSMNSLAKSTQFPYRAKICYNSPETVFFVCFYWNFCRILSIWTEYLRPGLPKSLYINKTRRTRSKDKLRLLNSSADFFCDLRKMRCRINWKNEIFQDFWIFLSKK